MHSFRHWSNVICGMFGRKLVSVCSSCETTSFCPVIVIIVSRARRVVRRANQIHESPPFITVLREGFNCGWNQAELVKIASDHVNPAGAWGSSGSLPAEQARFEVQDSPRRMVRWHAKHMSIPADPSAGSERGGQGLSGKGPHRFIGDEVALLPCAVC